MEPLVFDPLLKRARWGGRRLGSLLGKPLGEALNYAESWELVDHGADQSRLTDGPRRGHTLAQLVADENAALFGRHAGLGQFPLLIKFLDAHDRLSVQVHPDDARARASDPDENGKTEAWVVVDAEPGSVIFAGLRAEVDLRTLRRALREETLEECLHKFEVFAGDCIFIPAGTVHAIGEGIVLAEIQQSSDLTYRLHDWGRMGSDGRPRTIHIDQAVRCIDFERGPVGAVRPRLVLEESGRRMESLVECPQFELRRHVARAPFAIESDNRFHVLIAVEGEATLDAPEAPIALSRGRTVLLPADREPAHIEPAGGCVILDAYLP